MSKPQALFILHEGSAEAIYGLGGREELEDLLDVMAPPMSAETARTRPDLLGRMEVLLSGWGAPQLDAGFLKLCPNLRQVFYGAGSIKHMMTDAAWDAGIRVTSSYAANAIPVADYTLAQVILCLKCAYHLERQTRMERSYHRRNEIPLAGTYRSTVGIVSLGMIGRMVVQKLRNTLDINIIAYDPFTRPEQAKELGVTLASLEDVFAQADVVSLHTPWLKETEGMIGAKLLGSMKPYAAFINTSRGAVVNEHELIQVLGQRPDLQAVLDVTYPEPPVEDSPFYTLPNVFLNPHIAGSMRTECARMGALVVSDVRRYLAGEPLEWEITRERAAFLA